MMKFPLNAVYINKIKRNVRALSMAFETKVIPISQIGREPGGRYSVESQSWPINEALKLFVKEGAINLNAENFEIIKDVFFNIPIMGMNLPVTFSIDKNIETNLAVMTGLYAELYDVENRLRFFIASKLEGIYGENFITHLPRAVRDSIATEKKREKFYILDPRNKELEYTDFSDLKKIIENVEVIDDKTKKQTLIDKLDYLNEARTLVAHNNIIVNEEVQKLKDYCATVRKIIS